MAYVSDAVQPDAALCVSACGQSGSAGGRDAAGLLVNPYVESRLAQRGGNSEAVQSCVDNRDRGFHPGGTIFILDARHPGRNHSRSGGLSPA